MDNSPLFLKFVELHERTWGTQRYPGRPQLDEILSVPVVVFWYPVNHREERFTITLHNDMKDIEQYIALMVMNLKARQPERRMARLFVRGQLVKIKGVRLLCEVAAPSEQS